MTFRCNGNLTFYDLKLALSYQFDFNIAKTLKQIRHLKYLS